MPVHPHRLLVGLFMCLTVSGSAAPFSVRPPSENGRWFWQDSRAPAEAVHGILRLAIHERFIELEDGSRWAFPFRELHKIYDWCLGDRVTFRNARWWSDLPFELVRLGTQECIPVRPIAGALENHPAHKHLLGVNWDTQMIALSDGTIWRICPEPSFLQELETWAEGDPLMIGTHNTFWSSHDFSALLYNCSRNHWIAARRAH